eukprot:GHRR01006164.1.p1 GENE.GHRR01006164.1~~GHRR01006164.1.p1  ORF type:complete len:310 (+),score=131.66 GHRR01006164.1:1275-2204(+)
MQELQGLWRKDSPKLRAAALRSWAFMFTSLSNPISSSSQLEAQLATLAGLLHDSDVEVRAAAGEALALVYHASGLADSTEGPFWEEEEPTYAESEEDLQHDNVLEQEDEGGLQKQKNEDESSQDAAVRIHVQQNRDTDGQKQQQQQMQPHRRDADDMSLVSSSSVSGIELLMDRVRDLATNKGDRQRRNRRERTALKGAFRELQSVLEDGYVPEQKIKLRHGDVLIINTLEGNCTMNFLRRFLAGGFQVHLQGNSMLHSIFGFTPLEARPEKLTAQEKRYYRSPSSADSKARSQARRSQRSNKAGAGSW